MMIVTRRTRTVIRRPFVSPVREYGVDFFLYVGQVLKADTLKDCPKNLRSLGRV